MTHDEIMKAIGEKHRSFLCTLYDDPSRTMNLFINYNLNQHLSGKEYWTLLASSYQVGDEPGLQIGFDELKCLWESKETDRDYLMCQSCLDKFNGFKFPLTLFRGMSREEKESSNYGFSWTLSFDIAMKFAIVHHGFVGKTVLTESDKGQLIAFFNHRSEEEIIFLHTNQVISFVDID